MENCYYCGAVKTSREHVPPKQLFKTFEINKITVPSCAIHNTNKSFEDEIIIKAMLMTVSDPTSKLPFNPKVQQAISAAKPYFNQVKNNVSVSPIYTDAPKHMNLSYASIDNPGIDIPQWIRQITAGLVYEAIKEFDPNNNWDTAAVWSPSYYPKEYSGSIYNPKLPRFVETREALKTDLNNLKWFNNWLFPNQKGYPEEIYTFKICFHEKSIVFKHIFLIDLNWYVTFTPSPNTKAKLFNLISIER